MGSPFNSTPWKPHNSRLLWEGSPSKIDKTETSWWPYSNLSNLEDLVSMEMAVGQNQWCHFGVGAPPVLVYFSGDWDVHWGCDSDFDPWPNHTITVGCSEGLCFNISEALGCSQPSGSWGCWISRSSDWCQLRPFLFWLGGFPY